jgi:hypothetical protein
VLITLNRFYPHLPKIAQTAGIVVTSPTRTKGGSDRLLLFRTEPVSEKQCDLDAENSTSSDNEREFWPAKLDFIHDSKNR